MTDEHKPDEYIPMVLQVGIVDDAWQLSLKPDSNDCPHHVMAGGIIGEYVTLREYTRVREDYEHERETNHRMVAMIIEINRRNSDLLAAFEYVEWWLVPAVQGIGAIYECPWCEQQKDDGHAPDCAREAAIAKARG